MSSKSFITDHYPPSKVLSNFSTLFLCRYDVSGAVNLTGTLNPVEINAAKDEGGTLENGTNYLTYECESYQSSR